MKIPEHITEQHLVGLLHMTQKLDCILCKHVMARRVYDALQKSDILEVKKHMYRERLRELMLPDEIIKMLRVHEDS